MQELTSQDTFWCGVEVSGGSETLVDEVFERLPISVDNDAAELNDGLRAFRNPAHATVIAAARYDVFERTFYDASADGEVAPAKADDPEPAAAANMLYF